MRIAETLGTLNQADLQRMQQLLPEAFKGTDTKLDTEKMSRGLLSVVEAPTSDLIVARNAEGTIVSSLIVNAVNHSDGLQARIDEVVTDAQYRRQGYARATMLAAFEWARERQASIISLQSEKEMLAAHQLYKTVGFTASGNIFFYSRV